MNEKQVMKQNNFDSIYLSLNRQKYDDSMCIDGMIDLKKYYLLEMINCENNKITKIINICPKVKYINANSNSIIKFDYLPDNLETLLCDDNKIFELNNLPFNLRHLSCENNKLIKLDNLPFNLKYLSCGVNPLVNLDYLPFGLIELCLYGKMSSLKSLDNLPYSIKTLTYTDPDIQMFECNFPKDLTIFKPQTCANK